MIGGESTLAVWIILAGIGLIVPVAFLVLFTVLTVGFRWGSGWQRLAKVHAAIAPPNVPLQKWQTVRLGAVRYRRSATVGIHPDGLYLAVRLPFHPPLWIPWGEFGPPRETRIDLVTPATEMPIGHPPLARLAVRRTLYEQMAPYLSR